MVLDDGRGHQGPRRRRRETPGERSHPPAATARAGCHAMELASASQGPSFADQTGVRIDTMQDAPIEHDRLTQVREALDEFHEFLDDRVPRLKVVRESEGTW